MRFTHLRAALHPIPSALLRELRAVQLLGPSAADALRPVLSVLLAVGAATLLQLDDLVWAAFGGYMVMRRDIGELMRRAVHRIAGTIGGAVIGLILAPAIADSGLALSVALFATVWIGTLGTLTTRYGYAWLFFGLTAGMVETEALAAPEMIVHFAATRVAEVVLGTIACVIVGSLFSRPADIARVTSPVSSSIDLRGALRYEWLREHWLILEHTTRIALAVALLPSIWRCFEIESFLQTAVTAYVVMLVPSAMVRGRRHQTIYERIAHRILGCLLGSIAALTSIALFGEALLPALLTLCVGVWLGYQVQNGREGVSYLGTQFTLGLLTTLVQGSGPISSIAPGLMRLLGIVIGSVALCVLTCLWPLADDNS